MPSASSTGIPASVNMVNTATIYLPGMMSISPPHQFAGQVAKSGKQAAKSGAPRMAGAFFLSLFGMRRISILISSSVLLGALVKLHPQSICCLG